MPGFQVMLPVPPTDGWLTMVVPGVACAPPAYTAPPPGTLAVTMLEGVEKMIVCAVGFSTRTVTVKQLVWPWVGGFGPLGRSR